MGKLRGRIIGGWIEAGQVRISLLSGDRRGVEPGTRGVLLGPDGTHLHDGGFTVTSATGRVAMATIDVRLDQLEGRDVELDVDD